MDLNALMNIPSIEAKKTKGSGSPPKTRHWTIREEETGISHLKLLGEGGFGEVHEVRRLFAAC